VGREKCVVETSAVCITLVSLAQQGGSISLLRKFAPWVAPVFFLGCQMGGTDAD
jgi:hypothetical protein